MDTVVEAHTGVEAVMAVAMAVVMEVDMVAVVMEVDMVEVDMAVDMVEVVGDMVVCLEGMAKQDKLRGTQKL